MNHNTSHQISHRSFKFCTQCRSAIQRDYSSGALCPEWTGDPTATRFDSGDFAHNCRGQGAFYAVQAQHIQGQIPSFAAHFNFQGCFQGLCCYCAIRRGLVLASFADICCYHCKRRQFVVGEFSRLKRLGRSKQKREGVWHGLSPDIIDMILQLVLGCEALLPDRRAVGF